MDTSFVQITCDNHNRHKTTVFHLVDTHPLEPKEKGVYFGINSFKQSLDHIIPYAKSVFIEHFANIILKEDLKKGMVYNYTQRLGDSLRAVYRNCKLDTRTLYLYYKSELSAKGINTELKLYNPTSMVERQLYLTPYINTALNRPYEKEMIRAGLESPTAWFVKQMKWLILTSVLLIAVSFMCFAYTAKTLLSQHQLTVLKDDFINNMTHELNTPIASIQITTEALKSFDYETDKRREYLDMISYQTNKLAKLSAQVLNSGQTHIIMDDEQVEINSLLQNALKDLRPQLHSSNADIDFRPYPNPLYVIGNRSSLLNSFNNVIENALKYSAEQPSIKINTYPNNQFVYVTIADQGIGIQPEYRTRIFEKFFRVPQGNVHDRKGYGLGLSYVKDIIETHRGKVMTRPNEPQGTVFTVELPLSQ